MHSLRCTLEACRLVRKVFGGRQRELALPWHAQQAADSLNTYVVVGKTLLRQKTQICPIDPIWYGRELSTVERGAKRFEIDIAAQDLLSHLSSSPC